MGWDGTMKSPNEFWLHLHELSSAYEAEGKTPQERREAILDQLRRMPSIARREILQSFCIVAGDIPQLYWAAVQAHREADLDHSHLKADPKPSDRENVA